MPAPSRIDRHQKHHIEVRINPVQCLQGSCRIQSHTGLGSMIANHLQSILEVFGRFRVNADDICTGFYKSRNMLFRINHHQMSIKNTPLRFTERFHCNSTKSDIWYKIPVHHIKMNPCCSGLVDTLNFTGHISKIR